MGKLRINNQMVTKFWHEDPFFWFGTSLITLAHGVTNIIMKNRMNYKLHTLPFHAFIMGYLIHYVTNQKRKTIMQRSENLELIKEYMYITDLQKNEGKYLEEKENELKEIFKTIDF